jgi:hypothetical protein
MKAGLSITALAQEIERRAETKRDYIVPTQACEVQPDGRVRFGDQELPVTSWAAGQIADHCNIPAKYAQRLQREAPDLWATNVNHWFKAEPAKRLARTLDGKLRSFNSDRFRALDDIDLAEAALPSLAELELDIVSSQLTETKFYLKVVGKQLNRELAKHNAKLGDGGHTIVRDVLFPAACISNSEVGNGALSILVGTYTGGCSNLAFFNERSLKKYHLGGKNGGLSDEVQALLSDQTKRISDAAIWAQVRDVIKAAFDPVAFNSLCDTIAEAQGDVIDDPIKVIEVTTKRYGFTDGEKSSVLKHLINGADLSRYGLHSAITRAAEDIEDYDRASDFERLGGSIIELPRNQWQTIAEAA